MERARTAAPQHLVPMKENPAGNPAASADQSLEASPPDTVLLQTDEIPQPSKSSKLKQGDVVLIPGKGSGGDGGNSQWGPKKIQQPNEITGNTSPTQPLPSCCCSKTQQAGRFGFAVLVKDPPAINVDILPLNILPSDRNSLCDQTEMPKM